MANRVYYPLHYLALGVYCTQSGVPVHGLQTLDTTTNFNLDPVFELGQLELYTQIENLPSIEINASKTIDGYPLLYHLSTPSATAKSLNNRTNTRCDGIISVFDDAQDSASGVPVTQAYCSGLYINTLRYNIPTQGNALETVTLVGNDKIWRSSAFLLNGAGFNNLDSPASGVQRRYNVIMGNTGAVSVWPTMLPGITVTNGSGYNVDTGAAFGCHIQSTEINCNLNREDIYELGRRRPYFRYATFPVTVTCNITVAAVKEDQISANADTTNLTNEPIVVRLQDGTIFDLGNKNRCLSVNVQGGDTQGGIQTVTYNFQNFNKLDIMNTSSDPAHQA